jgi:hypothetical protein
MAANYETGPYDPCPCGSGAKYKFCCAAKAKANRHGKFPIGTVAHYGPDDQTTTKIVAGVVLWDHAEPILERWVSTGVLGDPKVAEGIKQFFARHGVKSVVVTDGNLGCPHEEGSDFPVGRDCPFCPFWAGKQGTARRDEASSRPPSEAGGDAGVAVEGDEEDESQEPADDNERFPWGYQDEDPRVARVEAIVGDPELELDRALEVLLRHLRANLVLPCEVRAVEDFRWEEPFRIDEWNPARYVRLKETQPSCTDDFQLLEIDLDAGSGWMRFSEDIAARVRRMSDGREFVLGLAELEATDKNSPNFQLLDDYAAWFMNDG